MGRHASQVSSERRLLGGVLGAGTILLLAWLLWAIAQPQAAPPTPLDAESSAIPTTSQSPPTTATTTPPTTLPPPTTTPTTVTSTTVPPIQLLADGLGSVRLGDSYEDALDTMTEILGPPDEDSGWLGARSDFGICPGTVVRVVRWAGLRLFFSDGPTDFGDEARHFFYYSQSPVAGGEALDLRTPRGIGLGSSVAELEEVYGRSLTISSTVRFGPIFSVESTAPGLTSGSLTGIGPDDTVSLIGGGFGCGG